MSCKLFAVLLVSLYLKIDIFSSSNFELFFDYMSKNFKS